MKEKAENSVKKGVKICNNKDHRNMLMLMLSQKYNFILKRIVTGYFQIKGNEFSVIFIFELQVLKQNS